MPDLIAYGYGEQHVDLLDSPARTLSAAIRGAQNYLIGELSGRR